MSDTPFTQDTADRIAEPKLETLRAELDALRARLDRVARRADSRGGNVAPGEIREALTPSSGPETAAVTNSEKTLSEEISRLIGDREIALAENKLLRAELADLRKRVLRLHRPAPVYALCECFSPDDVPGHDSVGLASGQIGCGSPTGSFCLECTPDDGDDPDYLRGWPCPTVQAITALSTLYTTATDAEQLPDADLCGHAEPSDTCQWPHTDTTAQSREPEPGDLVCNRRTGKTLRVPTAGVWTSEYYEVIRPAGGEQ